MTRIRRLGLLAVFALALLVLGSGAVGAAGRGVTPALPFPVSNGEVTNSAVAGSTLYLGGTFSRVGTASGPFASISAATAHAATLPHANDDIYEVVSDMHGGWFISGVFTAVGTAPRPGLAHIKANGALDTGFDPPVSQPSHLAISPDGVTLYLTSDFQSGGGSYIDAIDTATGAISVHHKTKDNIGQFLVSPDGKTLYAAGVFGKGPGVEAISATTGKDLRWFKGPGSASYSIALSSDGKTVYDIHGDDVEDTAKWVGYVTAWNTASGRRTWNRVLKTDGHPLELVLSKDGKTLYTGGAFTEINGAPRAHLAAFRTTNGSITPFSVATAGNVQGPGKRDDDGWVWALATANTTLYVGGTFTSLGGESRFGLGAIDTKTGTVTGWAPEPNGVVDALAVSANGHAVGVGGGFNATATLPRDHVAAIDLSTDSVTAFAPDFGNSAEVDAMVLSPDHSTLYVGGSFETADGAARTGLAAFSTTDGTLTSFNPDLGEAVYALAISPDGGTLYASGGAHQLRAVSTSTGATTWSISAGGWWDTSLAVSPNGATVYASQLNASPALRAFAAATGASVPGFNPPSVSTGGSGALLVSPDGSTVYSGDVGFDAVTGAATFQPTVDGAVGATALSADGTHFFLGGRLHSVNGVARSGVAEIDVSSGQVTSLDPHIGGVENGVEMVAVHGSTLIAGGAFDVVGKGHTNLARFSIP